MSRTVCYALALSIALNLSAYASNPLPSSDAVNFPLIFEPNSGQTASQVQYLSRSHEGTLFFTQNGVTILAPGHRSFRLFLERPQGSTQLVPEQQLESRSNYLDENGSNIRSLPN